MKRILIWAVMAFLAAPAAWAEGNWFVQGQGSLGIYTGNRSNGSGPSMNTVGFGGSGSLGYAFDKNFSLAAQMGYEAYAFSGGFGPGAGLSLAYLPVELVAQYRMEGGVRPYGFLGAGVAFNTLTEDGKSMSSPLWFFDGVKETDLILSPGLGLAFDLSPKSSLFVQAKADLDFTSKAYIQDLLPKASGVAIFIPIELGLNFSLS